MCGCPATLRCARCRCAWYCGPKCQRAAWGAHKSACAAAVAAAARGGESGASVAAATRGGGGADDATAAAGSGSDAHDVHEETGGLDAAAHREIRAAVAKFRARGVSAADESAGVEALALIAQGAWHNNRLRSEFQAAVAAAGGVPLLSRVLGARRTAGAVYAAVTLVHALGAQNLEICRAFDAAGCIPRVVALLSTPSVELQAVAANALQTLAMHDACAASIARARGIPILVSLLKSPAESVVKTAAGALMNVSRNAANKVAIADAGGIPRLIALLSTPSVDSARAAAHALGSLSLRDSNSVKIANGGGIPLLIALLQAPSAALQFGALGALASLSINNTNKIIIAEGGGIPPLVSLLKLPDMRVQCEAAGALGNLAMVDANKISIAAAGAILPLVELLASYASCELDASKQIMYSKDVLLAVAGALRNLSFDDANAVEISAAGGIAPLVSLLRVRFEEVRHLSASTLYFLSVTVENGVACARAALAATGMAPLVELLGSKDDVISTCGAHALLLLSHDSASRAVLAAVGAREALRALLSDTSDEFLRASLVDAIRDLE